MRHYITLLTLLTLIGCGQTETKKVITTYDSGKPEIVYYYQDKDDTLNYRYEILYETGKRFCEGNFSNGKKNGIWTWWYKNGIKKDQCKFDNDYHIDTVYHWTDKGHLEDVEVLNSRQIRSEDCCNCNTTLLRYYENGNLKEKFKKINGQFVDSVFKWFENGKLKYQAFCVNGKLEGTTIEYDEDGGWKIRNYSNDTLNGKTYEHLIDTSGVILAEGQYANGQETGIWYWRDKDSILYQTATYENGKYFGDYKRYYKNGQTELSGFLIDDNTREGKFSYYDTTGKLTKTEYWKNGRKLR